MKVAELCELIVNLVTCHQHGEPYELPYQVTMAYKVITTIVAITKGAKCGWAQVTRVMKGDKGIAKVMKG